jgi:hypothetical protein
MYMLGQKEFGPIHIQWLMSAGLNMTADNMHNYERSAPMTRDMAAKLDGVPPLVLLSTQISTTSWGNTAAYRSSGSIPTGLYRLILQGLAAPKPFTQKVKSSNWGVQEGFAVVDDKLARSQVGNDSEGNMRYEIRKHDEHDLPRDEKGNVLLKTFDLKTTLSDIFADANKVPPKYAFLEFNNPDAEGILRFRQIDHGNPHVTETVFSINLNDLEAELHSKDGMDLVESQHQGPHSKNNEWLENLKLVAEKMQYSFPTYAQYPGELEATKIKVYGDQLTTVRDCDLDYVTRPPDDVIIAKLGRIDDSFFEVLNMTQPDDEAAALKATQRMIEVMYGINDLEWQVYNELKDRKMAEAARAGIEFNEVSIADKMPIVPEFMNTKMLSAFVVAVGMGTPLELYQAMEINICNTNLLSLKKSDPNINLDDFNNPVTRNAMLLRLNTQPLPTSVHMRDHFFIQHPAECHNLKYTSDRAGSVIVHGNGIGLAKNDTEAIKYLNKNAPGEYVPLNKEWLGEKAGANKYAEDWTVFYISHYDAAKNADPDLNAAVNKYIERFPEVIAKKISELPQTDKVDSFMQANPTSKVVLEKEIAAIVSESQSMSTTRHHSFGR